jgi:phosphoglycolate phosphatase-like HAD superfamily hydrolase
MGKRLFTDFDGPITDVSERYFQVYQFCLKKIKLHGQSITPLSKSEFWELKRSQIPEREIAIRSGLTEPEQAANFAKLRRDTVHSQPFFEFDGLNSSAIAALETAQNAGIELAVMTMRRERELFPVLTQHDLHRFFPPERIFCLANDYIKTGDTKDKPRLMARAITTLAPAHQQWMVGDTEADIIAGKTHNVPTIGVLCGIRNQTQLKLYQPDAIARDLQAAITMIIEA